MFKQPRNFGFVCSSSNSGISEMAVQATPRERLRRARRAAASGASGSDVEAVPGPAQFKLRTPGAM
eukprot:9110936-Alexandrium_andersonii.AAC.1